MSSSSSTHKPITIKLFVDKKSNKVVFAEAKKDFVDFLIGLLILPMGSVLKLLTKNKEIMAGCLGNLYDSVDKMNDGYIQPNQDKEMILKPLISPISASYIPLIPKDAVSTPVYFTCNRCSQRNYYYHNYNIACNSKTKCPQCNSCYMTTEVTYVAPKTSEESFAKEITTYMVTDNFQVSFMTTISSLYFFKEFNILDLSSIQEMEVDFGIKEGMKLLRMGLQSEITLTDVFLSEEIEVERCCN